MSIKDFVQKVNLYLDNELPQAACTQLLKDIDENPTYQQLWQQEQSFRTFLKSNIHKRKPSSSFLDDLKSKISKDLS